MKGEKSGGGRGLMDPKSKPSLFSPSIGCSCPSLALKMASKGLIYVIVVRSDDNWKARCKIDKANPISEDS